MLKPRSLPSPVGNTKGSVALRAGTGSLATASIQQETLGEFVMQCATTDEYEA